MLIFVFILRLRFSLISYAVQTLIFLANPTQPLSSTSLQIISSRDLRYIHVSINSLNKLSEEPFRSLQYLII